jgi:hypothetical protein
MIRFAQPVAVLLCLGLAVGCAPKFMPTPNLYAMAGQPLMNDLSPDLAGNTME